MAWSRSKPSRHNYAWISKIITLTTHGNCSATYSFNGIPFLFSHADGLSTRGQCSIIVGIFTKKVQELVWMCGDQLSKLRVASTKLLQNRLQHLWLLLNNLAKLLKLRIAAEKVEVTKTALCALSSSNTPTRSSTSTRATSSLLCSQIEEVHAAIVITTLRGLGSRLSRS